jgi:hypothetical protein
VLRIESFRVVESEQKHLLPACSGRSADDDADATGFGACLMSSGETQSSCRSSPYSEPHIFGRIEVAVRSFLLRLGELLPKESCDRGCCHHATRI